MRAHTVADAATVVVVVVATKIFLLQLLMSSTVPSTRSNVLVRQPTAVTYQYPPNTKHMMRGRSKRSLSLFWAGKQDLPGDSIGGARR